MLIILCKPECIFLAIRPYCTSYNIGPVEPQPSMDVSVKLRILQRLSVGSNSQVRGDMFMYAGKREVGVVKILEPMSPLLNYFEYEIVDRGEKCAIGIGVGELEYPLHRMPGRNEKGIGYHAEDGYLYNERSFGIQLGPTSTKGDRMGCGVDFDTDLGYGYVSVFFTRNGQQVSKPIKMKRPTHGLYPLVGMHSKGEKVRYLGHCRRLPDSVQPCTIVDISPWVRSNGVKFLEDGLTLEYCGVGLEGQDVGAAQTLNYCMEHGNHHFEMVIQESGKSGMLAIGLASSTYPLHLCPGSSVGSIAYRTDNGLLYRGDVQEMPFGSVCTKGDTVGCGFKLCDDGVPVPAQGHECNVFFTVNHQVIPIGGNAQQGGESSLPWSLQKASRLRPALHKCGYISLGSVKWSEVSRRWPHVGILWRGLAARGPGCGSCPDIELLHGAWEPPF